MMLFHIRMMSGLMSSICSTSLRVTAPEASPWLSSSRLSTLCSYISHLLPILMSCDWLVGLPRLKVMQLRHPFLMITCPISSTMRSVEPQLQVTLIWRSVFLTSTFLYYDSINFIYEFLNLSLSNKFSAISLLLIPI